MLLLRDRKDKNIIHEIHKVYDGGYASIKHIKKDDKYINTNDGILFKMSLRQIKSKLGNKIKPNKVELNLTNIKSLKNQFKNDFKNSDYIEDLERDEMLNILKD